MSYIDELKPFVSFHCINAFTKKKHRAMKEEDGSIFVFHPRRRLYGRRLKVTDFLLEFDVIEVDEEKLWKKRMKRALKCLNKSGLWEEFVEVFQNLLTMSYSDYQEAKKAFWDRTPISSFASKYPFLFEDGELNSDYFTEIGECRLKSMYFGKRDNKSYKEMIASHLEKKENFTLYRIPVNYDVTYEYDADKNKAWYSEEYRNCGNGHYYLALDNSTALFVEND